MEFVVPRNYAHDCYIVIDSINSREIPKDVDDDSQLTWVPDESPPIPCRIFEASDDQTVFAYIVDPYTRYIEVLEW
jgi:hypothetical protein